MRGDNTRFTSRPWPGRILMTLLVACATNSPAQAGTKEVDVRCGTGGIRHVLVMAEADTFFGLGCSAAEERMQLIRCPAPARPPVRLYQRALYAGELAGLATHKGDLQ